MMSSRGLAPILVPCAMILFLAALYLGRAVFAPVGFSLFTIALVWPLQRRLQAWLPKLLALAITTVATILVVAALGSLAAWGFGRAGQWLIANGPRFQVLYVEVRDWLEGHGLYAASILAEHFNASWLLRLFHEAAGRLSRMMSFGIVTLVFVILGLLEVAESRRKLETLGDGKTGRIVVQACLDTARKLQRYMLVRTLMSVMTGVAVWAFAYVVHLDLAPEWGIVAFTLNYIPFIGSTIATVFPAIFAMAQFETWEAGVGVFLGLNAIQFFLGSYLEPRVAGSALSVSPFMVLFAVFFWGLLWGIPGAFIGVPILIACVVFCAHFPASRWIGHLLSAG
jgi:AI-2 transport protein TqsA